jgi:predicted transcriptional regulator
MGEVTLTEVTAGSPAEIWDQFGPKVGCTYDEFASYVGDCHEVFAIELSDLKPYFTPLGIAQISHLIREDLHPPQSFLDVKMNQSDPWGKAISVAGLLHSWR